MSQRKAIGFLRSLSSHNTILQCLPSGDKTTTLLELSQATKISPFSPTAFPHSHLHEVKSHSNGRMFHFDMIYYFFATVGRIYKDVGSPITDFI